MKLRGWPRAATHEARSMGVDTAHTPARSSWAPSASSPASFRVTFPPRENPITNIGSELARRRCFLEARRLLKDHRGKLDDLAHALLEHDSLDEREILAVTGLTPPAKPPAAVSG